MVIKGYCTGVLNNVVASWMLEPGYIPFNVNQEHLQGSIPGKAPLIDPSYNKLYNSNPACGSPLPAPVSLQLRTLKNNTQHVSHLPA